MADIRKVKPPEEETYLRRVRPDGWANPKPREIYDLVVIGAGPGGIAAAELAARLGRSVALIERNRLGGNSLNAGSIPSKAIVSAARIFANVADAEEYGIPVPQEPTPDFAKILERMRRIRARIAAYHSADKLTQQGIDIFFGAARFESGETISVGEASLRFSKALVTTGARPKPSDIPGLDSIGYCTSASIFDRTELPKRIAVIGGGPLGCEMAQALRRLGAQVTIIQNDPKFLPREERDAAEILSRAMARDGVEIRLNTTVTGARIDNGVKILETVNNAVEADIETDLVLLSIGRVPNVEGIGLEKAGVVFDGKRGIATDDLFQTANPHIYAAGDVCMELKFTNAAQASARMAVRNALIDGQERHSNLLIPWCTYCDPEIAHIGMHVRDARAQSIPVKSFTILMHDVDRAITDGQSTGFVKIHIRDGSDEILGATIVATRASELINEMAVVMNAGVGMTALARMAHTYPAQSEGIMLAARAYAAEQTSAKAG
jgi:pyruvate/2-oxoglutarate dehydrogenase complex dihydrolipoamide dehydrogenase (E3) component